MVFVVEIFTLFRKRTNEIANKRASEFRVNASPHKLANEGTNASGSLGKTEVSHDERAHVHTSEQTHARTGQLTSGTLGRKGGLSHLP